MKKLSPAALFSLLAALFLAFPSGTLAEGRFQGRIGFEAAWLFTNDRLDPYADLADPSTAAESPSAASRGELFPMVDLSYGLDGDTSLYLATPFRAPGLPLALGVVKGYGLTSFDLSVFSRLDAKAWDNPYAAKAARSQTDLGNWGLRLGAENVFAENVSLLAVYEELSLDEDMLGALHRDLRRDGSRYELSGGYRLAVTPAFSLTPSVGFNFARHDGEANSYKGPMASLKGLLNEEAFSVAATLGYLGRDYRKKDPVFNETREETVTDFSILFTWKKPLDAKNLYLNFHGAASFRNSNITFYDAETYLAGIGVGFGF